MTLAPQEPYEPAPSQCKSCSRWKVRRFGPFITPSKYETWIDPESTLISYCEGCGAVRSTHEEIEE